jgi:transposase
MVKQQMYQEIQALKRKGLGIAAAAEALELDRKTVSKYYRMSEEEFSEYRREMAYRQKAFDAHAEEIIEVYEANGYRKLNVASVYDYLEERFGRLVYSEKTLRNYVLYLQDVGKLTLGERVRMYQKVPQLPFGRQMQMDFGQYRCRSGLMLYIFSAVLSASRYKFMIFQDRPFRTLDVISHMLTCFDYFGGLVEEVVIDQDSLLVVSENHGDIVYTETFGRFIEEMGLSMYVCRKADPESKGKVENTIKYVKQNFLSIRDFQSLDEANERLMKWLSRRANGRISQATKRIPAELMEHEREQLKPLRNSIFRKDAMIAREPRSVNDKSHISVGGSLYSVPSRYRKKSVEIYLTGQRLFVFDPIDGHEVCEHAVTTLPGTMVTDRSHFRDREHSTEQIRQETDDMFTLELWHEFLDANTKRFPRYVRDQCLEARHHFSGEIDLEVLGESLKFCLDMGTVSFPNLKDTYQYLSSVDDEPTSPTVLNITPELPRVPVRRRAIEEYRQVAASLSEGA